MTYNVTKRTKRDCIQLLVNKKLMKRYSITRYGGVDYFITFGDDRTGSSEPIKSWGALYKRIEDIGIKPQGLTDEQIAELGKSIK